ncbi:MAG TPA: NnrU family protein [Aestuariivirgaceae bacterium]|nr:NnrU family protein [Aestuariivirgaceae bacterium]
MTALIAGMIILFGAHLALYTPLRPALEARFGERPFKGAFTLVSLVGLAVMIWGYAMTRSGPEAANILYWPAAWTRHAAMLIVLLAFISLAAAFHKGRLKLWLKQPMSIGIALWAGAHLLTNGKVASVLLFGGFLGLALLDIAVSTARGDVPNYVPKPRHDLITVAAGLILYGLFLLAFHPFVLNVPII